jgi:hypothetical protein
MRTYPKLQPGLLISFSTKVHGTATTESRTVEEVSTDNTFRAKRETNVFVRDVALQEEAAKLRGKICSLVRGACSIFEGHLVCVEANIPRFEIAVREAQSIADEFNRRRCGARIAVSLLPAVVGDSEAAKIASDRMRAMELRAVTEKLAELFESMNEGIKSGDPEAIRKACNEARAVASAVDSENGERISEAIENAREAARAIAKRVIKGGEVAKKVAAELQLDALNSARSAMIDLSESLQLPDAGEIVPIDSGRDVDLDAADEPPAEPAAAEPADPGYDLDVPADGDPDAARAVLADYLAAEAAGQISLDL